METKEIRESKDEASIPNSDEQARNFPKSVDFLPKWLRFKKYNQFLEGVDIIPFKCPLAPKFDAHLKPEERFHFTEVYEYSVSQKKPITAVIDLTFTDKYYNPRTNNFFPKTVTHYKFKIPGKKIPSQQLLKKILDTMENVIENKGAIGIHCTHGINRTGFIVCSFLVERLKWDPKKAVEAFEKARGEKMTHDEYIINLLKQEVISSGTGGDNMIQSISVGKTEPEKQSEK